ncbi:hypothetical protein ACNTMW_10220 [Planosporangium sp. 12N6]
MLVKWMDTLDTLLAPKPGRQYTGRHRAPRTDRPAAHQPTEPTPTR